MAGIATDKLDVESIVAESQGHRARRRFERDVHSSNPLGAPGLLQIGDGRHGAVPEVGRLVLRAFAFELEHRDALLLTVGPRGKSGAHAAHDQLVIVAEGRSRQIMRFPDLDRAALGRHANARAPNIA